MNKKLKSLWKLCALILITMLLLVIPPAGAEAAKVLKFVPTEVYFDDSTRLTLVGQFQNVGNEYITAVENFIPVIYLDDEMYASDTLSFQVNLQPGYYVEVIMKFDVAYKEFSHWYANWDAFSVY